MADMQKRQKKQQKKTKKKKTKKKTKEKKKKPRVSDLNQNTISAVKRSRLILPDEWNNSGEEKPPPPRLSNFRYYCSFFSSSSSSSSSKNTKKKEQKAPHPAGEVRPGNPHTVQTGTRKGPSIGGGGRLLTRLVSGGATPGGYMILGRTASSTNKSPFDR